jgi:peptidoglycan/LPS O-acetylase OafA/YrhL
MWYVALLVFLYPLAPLLYRTFELSRSRTVIAISLVALILIITHIPVEKTGDLTNSIILNLQGTFKRTVSFVMGMYIAPYVKQGIKANALYIIVASAQGCLLFHFLMKEVFYVWLYVLPLLIVLCYILERLPEKSIANVFLLWIGAASLESYLTNVGIRALMPLYISPWSGNPLFGGHYLDYALVIVLGLIMSYLTHVMSNLVTNKI